jgi:hemoglobin
MKDLLTAEDIKTMVNSFYDKVNKDELLSPVFNDHAHVNWEQHLPKMYDFWDTILFSRGHYKGGPFEKHIGLPVEKKHFDRWLALFEENLRSQFAGPNTDEAVQRAKVIGITFWSKISHLRKDVE